MRHVTIFLTLLATAELAAAQWTAVWLHDENTYRASQVYAVVGDRQYGEAVTISPGYAQGLIWAGSSGSYSVLSHPPDSTTIYAAWGDRQGGQFNGHASVWTETPESRVDLNPTGSPGSQVLGMAGLQQVGFSAVTGQIGAHAALWTGSATSHVDLHPAGAQASYANATDGVLQGGYAQYAGDHHGVIWAGSAQSMIDLTPSFAVATEVRGMVPGEQVGYVHYLDGRTHAVVWHGSAASAKDLNPPGAGVSILNATCGSAQVGYANLIGFGITAGIWFGTAESFVPLGGYLPQNQYVESVATCVTEFNGQFYVGGYAYNTLTNHNEAFVWIGVPAPGTGLCLALGAALAARRSRRSPLTPHQTRYPPAS